MKGYLFAPLIYRMVLILVLEVPLEFLGIHF